MKIPVAIFILLIMTTACNLLQSPEPDAAAPVPVDNDISIQDTVPTPVSDFPEAGYQAYVDTDAGIAFQYPQSWFRMDAGRSNAGYALTIATYDIANAPGRGGIPADEVKLDISIGTQDTPVEDSSIDALEAAFRANLSDSNAVEIERVGRPDGTLMLLTRNEGFGGTSTAYTMIVNNKRIFIAGFGDPAEIEKIAMSVRRYP